MKVPRILHYPGSKCSMADWIISNIFQNIPHIWNHASDPERYFSTKNHPHLKRSMTFTEMWKICSKLSVIIHRILANKVKLTPYSREEYYNSCHVEERGTNLKGQGCFFGAGWRGVEKHPTEST